MDVHKTYGSDLSYVYRERGNQVQGRYVLCPVLGQRRDLSAAEGECNRTGGELVRGSDKDTESSL